MNRDDGPDTIAIMSQLHLFRAECPEPVRRPPDLAYIRRSLNSFLRLARDAEVMPWSESETESREQQFPKLAALLPAEEAEALTSAFLGELNRLRTASSDHS